MVARSNTDSLYKYKCKVGARSRLFRVSLKQWMMWNINQKENLFSCFHCQKPQQCNC